MEKIQIDEFYHYKFLSQLTHSPHHLACVVTSIDKKEDQYKSCLYLAQKNDFIPFIDFEKGSTVLFLDENTLLTISNKEEAKRINEGYLQTTFYKTHISEHVTEKAFTLPLKVSSYFLLDKNKLILNAKIELEYHDYHTYDEKKKAEIKQVKKQNEGIQVIDEIPWWSNGSGFTNKIRNRLFVYDMEKDQLETITAPSFNTNLLTVCASRHQVLFTGSAFESEPSLMPGLYLYDDKTKEVRTLVEEGIYRRISEAQFVENEIIIAATEGKKHGKNESINFYKINLKLNKISLLLKYDNWVGSSIMSDCRYGSGYKVRVVENKLYFITTVGNSSHLYCLHNQGKLDKVLELNGSIDFFDTDGLTLWFVGMMQDKLQEIYSWNLQSKQLTQISTFNQTIMKDKYVAKYNPLSIESCHQTIDGWVLLPKDYVASKKYPAILNIHGGPNTAYGEVFVHEMQVWANEGFFVFFCNPVGSDGRGDEFADIRGKYGMEDYQNIMDFTDAVLNHYPAIDQQRLAVTGGSYGGFMTNWIIGHTQRFACAVSQRSISNFTTIYGTSDFGYYFVPDQMAADPLSEEGHSKVWWHSPLKYAKSIKTPTLFIHSFEDYRCWIPEGMQLYTALMNQGVPARMCCFKKENHELSRSGKPWHRLRRLTEMMDWIKKYCLSDNEKA